MCNKQLSFTKGTAQASKAGEMSFKKSQNEQTNRNERIEWKKNAIKIVVEQTLCVPSQCSQCSSRLFILTISISFFFLFLWGFECVRECNIGNVFSLMGFFFRRTDYQTEEITTKAIKMPMLWFEYAKHFSKKTKRTLPAEWMKCFRHYEIGSRL